MPFDALVSTALPRSLQETLERHGVVPVSEAELSAHKEAQIQKADRGWNRNRALLAVAFLALLPGLAAIGATAAGLAAHAAPCPVGLGLTWLLLAGPIVGMGLTSLRSRSRWRELYVSGRRLDGLDVPGPIATLARRLQSDAPGSSLILGELVREEVVLDPYLLLVRGEERICLGIWEGTEIIAQAQEITFGLSRDTLAA
ncbi:MAG TPA: hypothetical protein VME92_20180 [Acetobacteraceae bacterium]|nr:hypothetical protein [Acetobacteraceae bacterium]